ncbi:hypothetical protein, partial [Paenibacillus alginolyticus]
YGLAVTLSVYENFLFALIFIKFYFVIFLIILFIRIENKLIIAMIHPHFIMKSDFFTCVLYIFINSGVGSV